MNELNDIPFSSLSKSKFMHFLICFHHLLNENEVLLDVIWANMETVLKEENKFFLLFKH